MASCVIPSATRSFRSSTAKSQGSTRGRVLDDIPNGIPIYADLTEALKQADGIPDYFIFGIAPATGMLSPVERQVVLRAIHCGMNIVNGLHEFLNDDPEFAAAAAKANVTLRDVRRPRDKMDLRVFSGRIKEVTCPRIAVLGTDCAIGKRTTATVMVEALNDRGIKAVLIGTGQTGLMQGARYGVAMDAVPSQFCAGELEATILESFEGEDPDVIFIEGQGSLSHPAYSTSSFIIRGSCPDGVVLQHAPGRKHRCDFEGMPMPTPASEIHLIETFADTKVIGLTINHEHMSDGEVSSAIVEYEEELDIPRHRRPDTITGASRRNGARGFPSNRETRINSGRLNSLLGAPRLEIDLDKIFHNAETLVTRLRDRGIAVTAVTKATLGSPEMVNAWLQAGVSGLGDSRIENIEALREGAISALTTLIRSPMLSQAERIVASADVSLNTELEVVRALSVAATKRDRNHGVVLMVELGDLREGIMPDLLIETVREVLGLPNITFKGIGTNLACRSGVSPDEANMATLSALADTIDATFGEIVEVVSGGNSANLSWALSGAEIGRNQRSPPRRSLASGRRATPPRTAP